MKNKKNILHTAKRGFLAAFACFVSFVQCREQPEETARPSVVIASIDSLERMVLAWSCQPNLPDSAIQYIEELSLLSEKKHDYQNLTTALKARQQYYNSRANFPETFKSAQERQKIAQLSGDSTLIFDATFNMGRLCFTQGTYLDALDYLLQLANTENTTADQRVSLLFAIGQTYHSINDDDSLARYYYQLAKEATSLPGFTRKDLKGFILFGEGNIYLKMNEESLFDFSPLSHPRIDSLQKAIERFEESDTYDQEQNYVDYCAIAAAYAFLGDFPNAREYEQKAAAFAKDIPAAFSSIFYTGAIIRYRERRFGESIALALKGLDVSRDNGQQPEEAKNAGVLMHAYKATGDYENAYKYLELRTKLRDAMKQQEKQNQILMYQAKYETKIKDEQLQREKARSEKYRVRNWVISCSLVALLIMLGVYIYLYLQKREAYRLLVQKNRQWAGGHFSEKEADATVADDELLREEEGMPEEAEENSKETGEAALGDNTEELSELMLKVYECIKKEKLYSDKTLSLESLSRHIGTNKNYLSRAINRVAEVNFKAFINEYRIKEAIKQISDPAFANKSFDIVAEECGFNDRTTFYRSFKKITGLSPSDFKRNLS